MFTRKSSPLNSSLDDAIDSLFKEMAVLNADAEEYSVMVDQLSKLYALKEQTAPKQISPDTLALIAGNLLGILLILNHERANVVTSKALSFVMKLR